MFLFFPRQLPGFQFFSSYGPRCASLHFSLPFYEPESCSFDGNWQRSPVLGPRFFFLLSFLGPLFPISLMRDRGRLATLLTDLPGWVALCVLSPSGVLDPSKKRSPFFPFSKLDAVLAISFLPVNFPIGTHLYALFPPAFFFLYRYYSAGPTLLRPFSICPLEGKLECSLSFSNVEKRIQPASSFSLYVHAFPARGAAPPFPLCRKSFEWGLFCLPLSFFRDPKTPVCIHDGE